jgi:methionyl-tRNA formyltransferase
MINLYLLGEKGYVSLINLSQTDLSLISNVIIGTDGNVTDDFSTNIVSFCQDNGLIFFITNSTIIDKKVKYNIAIGWRWLINDENKLIVFHDSLLPRYRGFNPLVTSLINGDLETGVTVLEGNSDYDRGNIILQSKIPLRYPLKINQAIKDISSLYASLLQQTIALIKNEKIKSYKQDEARASYSLWRDDNDYWIDWSESAEFIKRFIDAVGIPYKGAKTKYGEKVIFINDADVVEDVLIENRVPGKIIFKSDKTLTIVCGQGLITVNSFYDNQNNEVQLNNFRIRFQ